VPCDFDGSGKLHLRVRSPRAAIADPDRTYASRHPHNWVAKAITWYYDIIPSTLTQMDPKASNELVPTQTVMPSENGILPNRMRIVAREVFAVLFWCYVIVRLFFFDVDLHVIDPLLPPALRGLNFKLIVVVGGLALLVLFRLTSVLAFAAYVFFYPFVLLFWRIPFLVLEQESWSLAIGYVNAVAAFFGSLKYNLVIAGGFSTAMAIILTSNSPIYLWIALSGLFLILLTAFGRRFVSIFKPAKTFWLFETIISWLPKLRRRQFVLKIPGIPFEAMTQEQVEEWKRSLQWSMVLSRLCLFVARKLRDYGRSRLTKIASVFISLFMIGEAVVVFTFANYALWKIDPSMFSTKVDAVGLFDFFYYAFNRIVFCSMGEIIPEGAVAKVFYLAEAMCALFLIAIFFSLMFSTRAETQAEELNRSVESITGEGQAMERLILTEYQFNNVEAAMTALKKVQGGMLDLIDILSENK
jgi:hypothetical protein